METKVKDKEIAIALRRKGKSYREILENVKVAKSTLSLWLRSVGLSKKQKQRLTKKRLEAGLRGAQSKRRRRIELTNLIKNEAHKDIKTISRRELWLIGVMLYWAEGSKEKNYNPGSGLIFSNSDPNMVKLYLKWLFDILQVTKDLISFEIYIHENSQARMPEVKRYWSGITKWPVSSFQKVYFKKNTFKNYRKNVGDNYYGLIRVRVRKSSDLSRKVAGWIEGVNKYYWGVV